VDFLRRSLAETPKEDFVTIRIKAERKLTAKLRLDVLAILFRLFTSEFRVLGRLLGFDNGQWSAVLTKKNIIAKLPGAGLG
jgi:hypothetical protein